MSESKKPSLGETPESDNSDDFLMNMGYDLYPDRMKGRPLTLKNFFFSTQSREPMEQLKCEKKVMDVLKNDVLSRILISAINKSGCPFNYRRHISCEYCEPVVTGGYDPIHNQIVVCYNTARSVGLIQGVLFHELIHMYDYCTGEIDFKNTEHLACTEIRAANLTYCGYLSAFYSHEIQRKKLAEQHKKCVKRRALDSIMLVRPITVEEGIAAVKKVFDRCYNDMEPIGRRIRRSNVQADLAYSEAYLLGYD